MPPRAGKRDPVKDLSCQEVLEQLWEFLDVDSREELRDEVDSHLKQCHNCQVEVDSIRQTINLYRSDEDVRTPIHLSDTLKAALDRAYQESRREEERQA